MLLVRAPLRISFAGGGTDMEDYYASYGGMVVSATIDKYFYVVVNPNDGDGVHIGSSDYRCFYRWSGEDKPIWDGDLRLPRAILHEFGVDQGLSVFLASEIPPGTGLGSSSTVAVALVKTFSTLTGQRFGPGDIAETAYRIETGQLGSPCGRQDHYASAFGGINTIYFQKEGVRVVPLALDAAARDQLREGLLLFFLGSSRSAADILQEQRQGARDRNTEVVEAMHRLKEAAAETKETLERGELHRLGHILRDSWEHKKRLAGGVTNPRIDEIFERALSKGAVGGKVAGAGGGGFLVLYCEPAFRDQVCAEMESLGLYRMDFHFDMGGAKVLMNSGPHSDYSTATSLGVGLGRHV
jgi:D-glycero-alpha-D-manno-heptose-7-phosphate kinase